MPTEAKPRIRCAIYTRKSSEEGLEQSFNSLEAQREACAAYIASQWHEGWRLISTAYDDGGYCGGTMDRPALKRLLQDVEAGKIDAVVVYKVDRLTRTLSDFAKIVEIFDAAKVSFVSVTQQFNTTTSMGRLTLNVLLSFAQFEREVTGERIRDKIAASKRKGMWMGGRIPLGYDLKERKLVVNAGEAQRVRDIYRQYLRLGCVSKLKIYLDRKGIRTKERVSRRGRKEGGVPYSRGALYQILQNRVYLGEVAHRGQVYPGEHAGIVPRELWDKVQERLRTNNYGHRSGSRAKEPSLLVGLVYDERGNRFTPSHTVKNGKRYRYYVSQAAIKHPGSCHQGPVRIPAGELETAACSALHSFLESATNVTDALAVQRRNADSSQDIIRAAAALSKRMLSGSPAERRAFIRTVVSRIIVRSEGLEVLVRKQALRNRVLQSPARHRNQSSEPLLSLKIDTHLAVGGRETRLVLTGDSVEGIAGRPTHSIIKAVARAHDWYERIMRGELRYCRSIAKLTGLDDRYVSRILRCAFLAPDIVDAILEGRQPPGLTVHVLVSDLPSDWAAQRQRLGFAAK
jgi:DNA invertase Pin-like site-specific DNA recombinase